MFLKIIEEGCAQLNKVKNYMLMKGSFSFKIRLPQYTERLLKIKKTWV